MKKKIVLTCDRPGRRNYLSKLLVNTVRFVILHFKDNRLLRN